MKNPAAMCLELVGGGHNSGSTTGIGYICSVQSTAAAWQCMLCQLIQDAQSPWACWHCGSTIQLTDMMAS